MEAEAIFWPNIYPFFFVLVIYASKPMGMFQFFLHKTGQLILVNCQVLIYSPLHPSKVQAKSGGGN